MGPDLTPVSLFVVLLSKSKSLDTLVQIFPLKKILKVVVTYFLTCFDGGNNKEKKKKRKKIRCVRTEE